MVEACVAALPLSLDGTCTTLVPCPVWSCVLTLKGLGQKSWSFRAVKSYSNCRASVGLCPTTHSLDILYIFKNIQAGFSLF